MSAGGRFVAEEVLSEGLFGRQRFVGRTFLKGCFVGRAFCSEGCCVSGHFVLAPKNRVKVANAQENRKNNLMKKAAKKNLRTLCL